MLETELGKFLKVVSDRTTEGLAMSSKQSETEVAQGLGKIIVDFKYEAAKISGRLKTALLDYLGCTSRNRELCCDSVFGKCT